MIGPDSPDSAFTHFVASAMMNLQHALDALPGTWRSKQAAAALEVLKALGRPRIHEIPREHHGPLEAAVAHALMHGARLDRGELLGGVRFERIEDVMPGAFAIETDLGWFRVTVTPESSVKKEIAENH